MSPIRFPIISENQMEKYINSVPDSDLSIKIALQKIVNDFRTDKKLFGVFEKKAKNVNIKPYHLVPRQCSRKNIYICGGFTRPKGGRWSDALTLNTVERYDTFFKIWHECPSFQFNRSALGAGVINGQVCVVGGENDMLILDSIEMYDPITYEWTCIPGMTSPRSLRCWMGCTADNGLMYIVGGSNDLGDELTSAESFNPVTKEWTSLPDLNTRRSYPGVAFLNDCLYAVGGWNEGEGALNSVEKLDLKKGCWVDVAPMCQGRAGPTVVVVNNMLYVMGGRSYEDEYTAPSSLDTMEGYDPLT
ncbi:IPP-like protein, partial [Mya arenaria]